MSSSDENIIEVAGNSSELDTAPQAPVVTPPATTPHNTPARGTVSSGSAVSRTQTPEPRSARQVGGAATPMVSNATEKIDEPRQRSASNPSRWTKHLRWLWLVLCALDVAHVLPHPHHAKEVVGDDLAFAMLGYPCHVTIKNGTVEAVLQARVVEAKLDLILKKKVAVKNEDFKLAKEVKREQESFQTSESSSNLAVYRSVTRMFDDVCSPAPVTIASSASLPSWFNGVRYAMYTTSVSHELQHAMPSWLLVQRFALPSWGVREWYTQRLLSMKHRIQAYKSNCIQGKSSCMSSSWAILGHTSACSLAERSVRMRSQVKVDARLKGSAIMNVFLIVRDWYHYGFNVDLFERKRSSMIRQGANPSAEEVCSAVIDGSSRGNEAVTELAKELKVIRIGYPGETLLIYLAVAIAARICGIALKFIVSQASSPEENCAKKTN